MLAVQTQGPALGTNHRSPGFQVGSLHVRPFLPPHEGELPLQKGSSPESHPLRVTRGSAASQTRSACGAFRPQPVEVDRRSGQAHPAPPAERPELPTPPDPQQWARSHQGDFSWSGKSPAAPEILTTSKRESPFHRGGVDVHPHETQPTHCFKYRITMTARFPSMLAR